MTVCRLRTFRQHFASRPLWAKEEADATLQEGKKGLKVGRTTASNWRFLTAGKSNPKADSLLQIQGRGWLLRFS